MPSWTLLTGLAKRRWTAGRGRGHGGDLGDRRDGRDRQDRAGGARRAPAGRAGSRTGSCSSTCTATPRASPPREPGEALGALLRALGVPAGAIPRGDRGARRALPPAPGRHQDPDRAGQRRQRGAGASAAARRARLPGAGHQPQAPEGPGRRAQPWRWTCCRRATRSRCCAPWPEPAASPPDDPLLGEIAGLCGRLPLALRIAGALLRHRPAWSLGHLAGAAARRAPAAWRPVRRRARPGAPCSTCPTPAWADAQQAAVPPPGPGARPGRRRLRRRRPAGHRPGRPPTGLLQDLVDHNLLTEHAPGRYRLHDLMRAHARTLAGHRPRARARDAALDRLLHYYAPHRPERLASPSPATRGRPRRPGPRRTPPPCPTPRPPAPGCAPNAPTWSSRPTPTPATSHERTPRPGRGAGRDPAHRRPLRPRPGDPPGRRRAPPHRHGSPTAHATALTDLGSVRRLTGDLDRGRDALARALEIYRAIGDRLGEANALTDLGACET